MFNKIIIIFLLSINCFFLKAQFPGAAGTVGSTAIHQDSAILVNWAVHCQLTRGHKDIALPDSGYVGYGQEANAIGRASENGVVSLGDRGEAVLSFQYPIMDGTGPDFAVFENAFNDGFLELAFVEVSSNGTDFYRFPAVSNTQVQTQIATYEDSNDPTNLHNLAGKYRAGYGTPFDLAEIPDSPNLNKQAVTHVKIIDVVGCIKPPVASLDQNGHPINDPYPTNFDAGGFDLDAVGVIHQNTANLLENSYIAESALLYPNPTTGLLDAVTQKNEIQEVKLYSTSGELVFCAGKLPINIQFLPPGKYLVILKNQNKKNILQTIIKY